MDTESTNLSRLLSECENEPIHIPGLVQPHGILMTLRSSDLTILQISESVFDLLGVHPTDLLHQPLSRLMPIESVEKATKRLGDRIPRLLNPIPIHIEANGRIHRFDGILHRSGRVLILELERHVTEERGYGGFGGFYEAIREVTSRLMDTEGLAEVLELACQELKKLTGFGRVLVYRFDSEWNGEVLNEAKDDGIASLLHHRFPASDIPKQARDLYTRNWLRLIPDVNYKPSPVVPNINPITDKPLDMSNSVLRSVSPVHLEYMRNMGQQASMSVSLLKGKKLWGLISCHHPEPLFLKYDVRVAAEFIGQMVSAQIIAREESSEIDHKLQLKKLYDELLRYGGGYASVPESFSRNPISLLGLVDAAGAALCIEGRTVCVGSTPCLEEVRTILEWVKEKNEPILAIQNLTRIEGKLEKTSPQATGVLAISLPRGKGDAVVWFRPEMRSQTKWAGDPTAAKLLVDGKIHPRKSFETWYENSAGKSKPWRQIEVDAAGELRTALMSMALGQDTVLREVTPSERAFRESLQSALASANATENARSALSEPVLRAVTNLSQIPDSQLLLEGFSEFAVFLLDRQGRVQNWSSGARRLFGYESSEVLGQNMDHLFSEEDSLVNRMGTLMEKARENGRADAELWLFRNDESSFWAKIWLAQVRESNGSQIGFSCIIQDITKEKSAEEELKSMKLDAEAANKAKSAFLANISHEIRTPLGAVLGFSELMSASDIPNEERLELHEKVQKNGEQLTVLINDLLDISKIESGKVEIERITTELEPLLTECEQLFKLKAAEKGVALTLAIKGKLPRKVVTDPTRLRQIVINLLGNAIKFTPASGRVSLEASVEKINEVSRIALRVVDSGRGMSETEMAKLFKPFVQADVSTTRQYGGTGLGLFLSQRLARALGGDLSIEWSKPGEGSCFICTFDPGPINLDSFFSKVQRERLCGTPTSFEQDDLKDMNVLVVDDAEDNRYLLTMYLTKMGANVETAENGRQGVEKAMAGKFDAVIMDIQMPILDGNAAMRELMSSGYDRPVIALTAHAMKEEREQAFLSGFSEYLTKPVNRALLISTLENIKNQLV